MIEEEKDTGGRPVGALGRGSMSWRLHQMEPGEYLLIPDSSPRRAAQLTQELARYRSSYGGRFTVIPCIGNSLDASITLRFFMVLRDE